MDEVEVDRQSVSFPYTGRWEMSLGFSDSLSYGDSEFNSYTMVMAKYEDYQADRS